MVPTYLGPALLSRVSRKRGSMIFISSILHVSWQPVKIPHSLKAFPMDLGLMDIEDLLFIHNYSIYYFLYISEYIQDIDSKDEISNGRTYCTRLE